MAQHREREIVRLRPRPAQDGVGLEHRPTVIGRGPFLLVADHKIELTGLEDAEIDAQPVGHGIEAKDFPYFRKIGIEVAVEEYPASHAATPPAPPERTIAVSAQRPMRVCVPAGLPRS